MNVEAILVYDVSTSSREGERRLREVAHACEGVGNRVQKSVFELRCSEAQLITLTACLSRIIDATDSIRIYRLRHGSLDGVQTIGVADQARTPGAVII